jgi:hypothetical protein
LFSDQGLTPPIAQYYLSTGHCVLFTSPSLFWASTEYLGQWIICWLFDYHSLEHLWITPASLCKVAVSSDIGIAHLFLLHYCLKMNSAKNYCILMCAEPVLLLTFILDKMLTSPKDERTCFSMETVDCISFWATPILTTLKKHLVDDSFQPTIDHNMTSLSTVVR